MKFSTIRDKILTVRHENKSQLLAETAFNTSGETLIKTRIIHVTAVTKNFWNRFYKEYLLSLREKH